MDEIKKEFKKDINILETIIEPKRHNHKLYTIYILGFFFGLHTSLPAYINSSFLGKYGTGLEISTIFTLSSIATIIGFLLSYPLVKKLGNFRFSLYLIMGLILTLTSLIYFNNIITLGLVFIINSTLLNLFIFSTDIFLEKVTTNSHAGKIRGTYLTLVNLAWIISPVLSSTLVVNDTFWRIYAASAFILIPILYLLFRNFHHFKDAIYPKISVKHILQKYIDHRDFKCLSITNIILNVFYSWMTIYVPIYLNKNIGLEWSDIGLILTIMLLPFVLVDIPLGRRADKNGEKNGMIFGVIVMGLSTASLAFVTAKEIWVWALILFTTRIGAASLELMIETYFFKKIHHRDAGLISIFRISRQLAYLLGPILYTITILFVSPQNSFLVLGAICLLGIPFIAKIKDIK